MKYEHHHMYKIIKINRTIDIIIKNILRAHWLCTLKNHNHSHKSINKLLTLQEKNDYQLPETFGR